MTREYRVTKAGHPYPDIRRVVEIFRDDERMWINWRSSEQEIREAAEDGVDLKGLSGVAGIAEATAREQEAKGAKDVRIEVREVGPWQEVER